MHNFNKLPSTRRSCMIVSPCELQANRTLHAKSTGKTSLAFWPKMASKVVSEHLIFRNFLCGEGGGGGGG